MSDQKEKNPFEELQKQMREAFQHGNPAQFFNQAGFAAPADGGSGDGEEPVEDDEKAEILKRIHGFNLKPREVRDYLDRFVIRQQEAKKVLSVAICDHFNHVRQCLETPDLREKDYAKQNIILLGPTGVGKTYLMRCISKLIGVPFVKADATKFSETGYVGHDVEDLVRDLVKAANGDVDLAQYGIIYIDEIDKIASSAGQSGGGGRDVSGRGVQINLLKLMEETDVNLFSQTDLLGQMQAMFEMQRGGKKGGKRAINTRHILFIVSGAFDRLSDQIKKRVESGSIGFGNSADSRDEEKDYLNHVTTTDFISYGFEPEFIGRLPVRVHCEHLSREDLEKILLQSEGSILSQYKTDFKGYGIGLDVTPDAIRAIAQSAASEKTGARALMTVLERTLRGFKFELPSTSIQKLSIDGKAVENPANALRALLKDNASRQREVLAAEVKKFTGRFEEEHGIRLTFEEDAIEALVDLSLAEEKTIRSLCETRLHDLHHGLQLIGRNTGQKEFTLTAAMVKNPDKELSRLIVESFAAAKENG